MGRFAGKVGNATWTIIDRLSNGAGYLAAGLNIALALLVFSGVIGRYVFHSPINWRDEVSAYIFIFANILALCYATYVDSHVSAEMLFDRFPPRVQQVIRILGYSLMLVCIGFIVYFGFNTTYAYYLRGWRSDTEYEFLLWPIMAIIPVGFTLFGLQCVSKIRLIIIRMKRGASSVK
jgi:C4-dicarboxylate transporter, DctQ subunit